jgi:hypothetical protein
MLMLLGLDALAKKKRIALLIGNKDYKAGVGALRNPLNDIREALRIVGFEVPKPANLCVESLKDQGLQRNLWVIIRCSALCAERV